MSSPLPLFALQPRDLDTDQEVRWCPGCGDFAVLAQFKQVLARQGLPRERIAIVSGSGCAGRLVYYLNTYGFHTLHGRAPAVATGLKVARPDLQVWVVTGDGDGLAIGTSHLIHALRRNVDVKILLFNNEVMGLTRGQPSPTSRLGTVTRLTPGGVSERPLQAVRLALAAEATFVARTIDVDVEHLTTTLERAAQHRGAAFVEIYQNCKVFNDEAFAYATDKAVKAEATLYLEHGQPLLFGKDRTRGLRLRGLTPQIVTVAHPSATADLLHHDEAADEPTLALILSQLTYPEFPECFGVFRQVKRPIFGQAEPAADTEESLAEVFAGDDAWTVPEPGSTAIPSLGAS